MSRAHRTLIRLLSSIALFASPLDVRLGAQPKPTLTPKDLGKWESLGAVRLSPNGVWMSYALTRGNDENDLRLRGGTRDTTVSIPYGLSPAFSADSRWLASLVGVAPKERERLTKEKKPVHTAFALRNLTTGETIAIADVSALPSIRPVGFCR